VRYGDPGAGLFNAFGVHSTFGVFRPSSRDPGKQYRPGLAAGPYGALGLRTGRAL